MGLDEVKNSILESANQKARDILEAAKKDAAKIDQDTKAQLKELEKKYLHDLQDAEKNLEKIKLAVAYTEAKHILLKAKKGIVDNAFDNANKRIAASQKSDYVKKLLDKAKKELDVKYVYCAKSDIKKINGFNVSPVEISGGIIAENPEKTVRIDFSYETIFDTLKNNVLQDVARKLFK